MGDHSRWGVLPRLVGLMLTAASTLLGGHPDGSTVTNQGETACQGLRRAEAQANLPQFSTSSGTPPHDLNPVITMYTDEEEASMGMDSSEEESYSWSENE